MQGVYKSAAIHQAAVAVTTTTAAEDISGGLTTGAFCSATALAKIVVVGAPSVAASIQLQVSPDNANWYDLAGGYRETDKVAGTYTWAIPLPLDVAFYRTVFTQQTGGTSSTYSAQTARRQGM